MRGTGGFPDPQGGPGNQSSFPTPSGQSSMFPSPPGDPFSATDDQQQNADTTVLPAQGAGPDGGFPADGKTPRPPFVWTIAAIVVALIGGVLGGLGYVMGGWVLPLVGWLLAGPVAIGLIGAYGFFNAKAAARPWYGEPGWCRTLYWVAIAVIAIAVVISAVCIALYVGRM